MWMYYGVVDPDQKPQICCSLDTNFCVCLFTHDVSVCDQEKGEGGIQGV